jgi:uncharacterized cupredoxin-like copper-binding protein
MRRGRLIIAGVALVAALGVVAGCSSSSKSTSTTTATTSSGGGTTVPISGTPVHVRLGDTMGIGGPMTLVASPATAPAGDVTFIVKNAGTIDHEMVVLKTSVPYTKIPVADAGDPPAPVTSGADKISEANNVGETGDPNLKPGETRTFTIKNMTAGTYALVCNIADHYAKGMRAPFTVT